MSGPALGFQFVGVKEWGRNVVPRRDVAAGAGSNWMGNAIELSLVPAQHRKDQVLSTILTSRSPDDPRSGDLPLPIWALNMV